MTIGDLSRRTGLAVRTLRFYADAGVLPEAGRTEAGYRLFAPEAVARARLLRTLRELGVGLEDIRRVLAGDASLVEIAAAHAGALDAQMRTLRLQRSVLSLVVRTTDPKELERMTDLATLSGEERRRILDDYLDAVFGTADHAIADRFRMGAPDLPDDPSPGQVAAWIELAGLLQDPGFVAVSRRMAQERAAAGSEPSLGHVEVGKAVGRLAGDAARAGVDPDSPEALAVVERLQAVTPTPEDRAAAADRIERFTDRRVARYWTLVGIVNDWPPAHVSPEEVTNAWVWYAAALRAHAGAAPPSVPG